MKFINTKCALCNSEINYRVIFESRFDEKDFNSDTFSARRLPDRLHFQIVKCKKDNLVRSNPILDPKTLANLYKQSQFKYDKEVPNLIKTYLKALDPILKNLPKNAKILEIGCGNGFLLKALKNLGFKNVFGLEPSRQAIIKAHQSIKQRIKIDILKQGLYKKGSFDLICFFQVLDHVANPNEFLKICFDLLIPSGYILSFNHNIDSFSAKLLKDKSPIIDIEHTYLYSPQTLKLLFEKNKFTPIKVYAPPNFVSIEHLVRLSPLPKPVKQTLLSLSSILNMSLLLNLGNLCIIARKLSYDQRAKKLS